MEKIVLGKTGLEVSKISFGALPIQRVDFPTAEKILLKAYHGGINFFDTARAYSDSEAKMGRTFAKLRKKIIIATKSGATTPVTLMEQLETSLKKLRTDYIDLFQLHNPAVLPEKDEADGIYNTLLKAKRQGKIRYIGITNHRPKIARKALLSGLFDTLQFPLSYISDQNDFELAKTCQKNNIGFIAMKALAGGLLTNAKAAFAFLNSCENVVPIWGIQRETELNEFLKFAKNPPELTSELQSIIDKDRRELSKSFCRACGYCLPCSADISIPTAARIALLVNRLPNKRFLEESFKKNMEKIEKCTECGDCSSRCPYGLNPPEMLKDNLRQYLSWYEKNKS